MKHAIFSLVAATTLLVSQSLMAQTPGLHTALFSDGYLYRHVMNPALANDDSYFSFPMLGNNSVQINTNLGISDLIPKGPNGKLVTFMHPSVKASDFLGNLEDLNKLSQRLDMDIFSCGFRALGGYSTIELSLREELAIGLPKDLFAFMKEMDPNRTYQLDDMEATGHAYVDLALGHSHAIGEHLRVGGKVHLLVGAGYAHAKFTHGTARFAQDAWQMKMEGDLDIALGNSNYEMDDNQRVDGFDQQDYSFGDAMDNLGIAFDLGLSYQMGDALEGLELSAAICHLGSISWGKSNHAYNDGREFRFDGFTDLSMHEGSGQGTIDDQWSQVRDDLEAMYSLRDGGRRKVSESLAPSLVLGASYNLPSCQQLTLGLLYNQQFTDIYSYAEGRAIVNYSPADCFDLSASAAVTTYGFSAGMMANLHLTGFSLYLGTDHLYLGKINSNYLPLQSGSANLQFGISFPMN